jgi:hypothetical protein
MSISMLKFLSVACLPCYKNSVCDCTLGLHKIQSGRYKKIAASWDVTPRGLIATEQTTEVTFNNTVFVVTSHVYLAKFITLLGFVRFITSQANSVETLSVPYAVRFVFENGYSEVEERVDGHTWLSWNTDVWVASHPSVQLITRLASCLPISCINQQT